MQRYLGGAIALLSLTLISCGSTVEESAPESSPVTEATPIPLPSPEPPVVVTPEQRAEAATLRQEGLALRNQGDIEGAIAPLKAAVALESDNISGYVLLGWTEHLAGQRTAAAETLQDALRQNPDDIPALNALGIVYLVDGALEQAVENHTRAVDLDQDNKIAHYNLSLAYQRLGDFEAAIARATRATELEPGNPHPWVALAIAHASAEEMEAAIAAYQQAIQVDARYRDASQLTFLEQAGFSADQIEAAEAIRVQL